jgi:hypothetical protein
VADLPATRYGWGMSDQEPRDRRRTVLREGQIVQFVHLPTSFAAPFERVTSVSVVPFAEDGRIVVALLDVEEFLAQYRAGDTDLMRQTVLAAQRALAGGS